MTLLLLLRSPTEQSTSDSQNAYLVGSQNTSDTQPAYIHGKDTASDSQIAYLLGELGTSDSTDAYTHGKDVAADTQDVYLQGSADSSDSQNAYTKGEVSASDSQLAYLAGSISTTNNQYAYLEGYGEVLSPSSDISQSDNWQREDSSTSNLYVSIDEFPENDTDYVWYDDSPEGKYFEVSLTDPTGETVPEGDVHIVWRGYRKAGTQAITVKVELRQSTTVIASQSKLLTNTPTTFKYSLTSGEISSITDWTNLRLRFIVEDVS